MKEYSISEFGAVGDGIHDDTQAIAQALALAANDGGIVSLPAGLWLTGPIEIGSNVQLQLQKDAVLRFIDAFDLYHPVWTRWEGVDCWCMHPCIYVNDAHDVRIFGEGTIDGNGQLWWETSRYKRETQKAPQSDIEKKFATLNVGYETQPGGGGGRQCQFLRPPLVQFQHCNTVTLEGVTVINSPFWTIHPVYCDNVVIRNIHIKNPYDAPNTDGIDIDSCSNVQIEHCIVDVGDDGIALKSGSGLDAIGVARPTCDVVVSQCVVKSAHGGIVIGSETAGGIYNVKAHDCVFDGTDRGIRIKTRRGRGGHIHDLTFCRLSMKDNLCPFAVNMYYRCGALDDQCFSLDMLPICADTPRIERVVVKDCHATGSRSSAGFIVGLPECPITGLEVANCSFEVAAEGNAPIDESEMYCGLPEIEGRGMRLRNVHATLQAVQVTGCPQPFIIEDGCQVQL